MAQFVLLLRDNGSFPPDMSAEDMQNIIERYRAWSQRVGAQGQKLRDGEGRVMRSGGAITDGPFTEAKEVLGGFFIINAKDYDEAVRISSDCPHLDFGSIEVREVEPT